MSHLSASTCLLLALLSSAAAISAAEPPTLDGLVFEVTTKTPAYTKKDGKSYEAREYTNTWNFLPDVILIEADTTPRGYHPRRRSTSTDVLPYSATWNGTTAIVNIANRCVLSASREGLSGTWQTPPVEGFADGKSLEQSIIGRPLPPRFGIHASLAKAKELQLQREPREALLLYTILVQRHSDMIEVAGPALAGLVDCYRLLRGDAAAEKAYADLATELHLDLPPLDAAEPPDAGKLAEQLLWRPWIDGSITWSEDRSAERRRSADGTAEIKVHLEPRYAKGEKEEAPRLTCANEDPFPVTARLPNGSVLSGSANYGLGSVTVTIPNAPRQLDRLVQVTGQFRFVQSLGLERREVPLVQGSTWETATTTGTIVSLTESAESYHLEVLEKKKRPDASSVTGDRASRTGDRALFRSFRSWGGVLGRGGVYIDRCYLDESESPCPLTLKTSAGLYARPTSLGYTEVDVGTISRKLDVTKPYPAFKASMLVVQTPAAGTSTRDIPFIAKDIDLP